MNKKTNFIIVATGTILLAIILIFVFSKKDMNEIALDKNSSSLVDEFFKNSNDSSVLDEIVSEVSELETSSESLEVDNKSDSNNTEVQSEPKVEEPSSKESTAKQPSTVQDNQEEETEKIVTTRKSTSTQIFQPIKEDPFEETPKFSSDDKIDSSISSSKNSVAENNKSSSSKDSPTIELSSEGKKIYNDLTGDLANRISNTDKTNLYTIINKITSSGQENTSSLYKKLIENLDQLTMKNYSQDELNYYKNTFANISSAQGNVIVSNSSKFPQIFAASVSSGNNSITQDENIKELAGYSILSDGNISGPNISKYKEMWENVKKIIPFDLLKGIKYFVPFESSSHNGQSIYGLMSPVDDGSLPYQWALGVNANADSLVLPYILVHEYGHFISLKDSTALITKNNLFEVTDVLKKFSSQCLGYISKEMELIDDGNQYLFYARHKNDFITMYASIDLMEDFAESFARFVTDSLSGSERFNLKNSYFKNNSYFSGIKSKILNNIKNNGTFQLLNVTR